MTTIDARIPVAGLRQVTPPTVDLKTAGPERWAAMQETMGRLSEPSPAEIAAQIARQRAEKVHTVYRVNGEIVGTHQHNGWTTFAANGDGRARGDAEAMGRSRGLSGDALNDFVADQIAASLTRKYGSAFSVETYRNAADAPTVGSIHDAMVGKAASAHGGMQDARFGGTEAGGSLGYATQRIAFDPEILALMNGVNNR